MAGEWKETILGDVIELKRGYDLPQQQRRFGRVPLVSSSGVTDYHAVAMVKGPGVVTGRYGTLGQVFFVPDDFWPLNTTLYVRDFKGNAPRFISYFLRGLDFLAYSDKAAVPGLNRNHLHQARVRLPSDISEQRAVAHILSTLDDKIELNRRMNETLEAMARALFKSWFVAFDPVRAKVEGRQPARMDVETAALFPDAFEDSMLGKRPKGWYVGPLGGILELKRGYDLPQQRRIFGFVPIYSSSGLTGYHSAAKVKGPGIVTGRYGTIGEIFFVNEDFWPLNTTLYVRNFKNNIPRFVYYILHTLSFEAYLDKAAVPGINRNHVHQEIVLCPPVNLQCKFVERLEPFWQRQAMNNKEVRTLATLHDTLLPKLISGELRVKDAERFLGRTV
jgi:type I restriction enzyme S subunit